MKGKVIKLLGLGGNFKSSISSSEEFKDFIQIPECHREYEALMNRYGNGSNTIASFCVKQLVTRHLLQLGGNFICDRTLLDQAIINELIKTELTHYKGFESKHLTIERAVNDEVELFDGFDCTAVLLINSDRDFVSKLMSSPDERSSLYKDVDTYMKCQDYYVNVVKNNLSKLGNRSVVIDIGGIDNIPMKIDSVINKIKNTVWDL